MKKLIAVMASVIAVTLLGGAVSYWAFTAELKNTGFPVGENAVCTIDGDTATVTGSGAIDVGGRFEMFVYEKAGGLNPYYALMSRFYTGGLPVEKVILGPEIAEIYSHSFFNCPRLKEIAADEANPYLTSVDGVLFSKDMSALLCYPLGREDVSYTVPEGVKTIGENAFCNCEGLRTVSLPRELETVGVWAFMDCGGLTEVSLPEGLQEIGVAAFSGCFSLERADLPDSLVTLGASAFYDCGKLTSAYIPAGLASWGGNVFRNCDGLISFTVAPEHAELMSEDGVLFSKDQTVLKQYPAGREAASYTVPEGVTEIGESAFENAASLKEIALPETLTKIGEWAFADCAALETVTVPGGVKQIGYGAFSYCTALREATLSDGVKYVNEEAFLSCPSLSSVTVPDSVVHVGDGAFGFDMDEKGNARLLRGFTLYCGENSAAKRYAEQNGIAFEIVS